jgi:hypothetical protein
MSHFHKDIFEQAQQTADAIGMELTKGEPKSHDYLSGYDYGEMVELVGTQLVEDYRDEWSKSVMVELESSFHDSETKKFKSHAPVTSKRGKTKGLRGWVVNEMPSQYNENETAYLINDLHGEGGWVNGKSLALRVPEIGEQDILKKLITKRDDWKNNLKRGVVVHQHDNPSQKGILLGFGNHGFSVAVQWEGMQAEEWVSVGKVDCPSYQG